MKSSKYIQKKEGGEKRKGKMKKRSLFSIQLGNGVMPLLSGKKDICLKGDDRRKKK